MPGIIFRGGDYDVTVVPNVFIDHYLTKADATFVKVYIYAKRCMSVGGDITNENIADALGILESDVVKAWNYWAKQGVVQLAKQGNNLTVTFAAPQTPDLSDKRSKRISSGGVSGEVGDNPELKKLYDFASQKIGILSSSEVSTLYSFYDWLKLPTEVIVMLFEYCDSIGKLNMRAIEKNAVLWAEHGITSVDAVEEFIYEQERAKEAENKFKETLGIERKITDNEKKYYNIWVLEYALDFDVIKLAYEQTVQYVGRLDFKYMNTILTNWYNNGIDTKEKAAREIEAHQNKKTGKTAKKNGFNNFTADSDEPTEFDRIVSMRRQKNKSS